MLFDLYSSLRELGHPDYLSERKIPPIRCSIGEIEVNEMVKKTNCIADRWGSDINNIQNEYTWLLYLGIPKILQLFSFMNGNDKADKIFHEISFLFSQHSRIETFKVDIEVCI